MVTRKKTAGEESSSSKLYYSIGEVSTLTGLKQHVLRYWEDEFPDLKPKKNRAGNRAYRVKDIKLIFLIKRLLYDERYTIEGAREKLKKSDEETLDQLELSLEEVRWRDVLSDVRKELLDLLGFLQDDTPPKSP